MLFRYSIRKYVYKIIFRINFYFDVEEHKVINDDLERERKGVEIYSKYFLESSPHHLDCISKFEIDKMKEHSGEFKVYINTF